MSTKALVKATSAQRYARLVNNLAPTRQALVQHKLYGAIRTRPQLQTFMESHVFAVWDFMSLVKTLQQRLAPAHAPWTPPKHAAVAGAINDIIASEESDHVPEHLIQLEPELPQRASHLTLYLAAMRDVKGATAEDATAFEHFLGQLEERCMAIHQQGSSVDLLSDARMALSKMPNLPAGVEAFCSTTLAQCAPEVPTHQVAAAFLFGREDPIPSMFERLLTQLPATEYPFLRFYLQRHIELDGDEHADLGRDMLCQLCEDSSAAWAEAEQAAHASLVARIGLWDAVAQRLME